MAGTAHREKSTSPLHFPKRKSLQGAIPGTRAGAAGALVDEASQERVLPALAAALKDKEQRQTMATIAEQLIEKGFKRGHEKGFAKGFAKGFTKGFTKGRRRILLQQLECLFGPVPAQVRKRVKQGELDDLERWAAQMVTASTLDAVFNSST